MFKYEWKRNGIKETCVNVEGKHALILHVHGFFAVQKFFIQPRIYVGRNQGCLYSLGLLKTHKPLGRF